jgi:hypothetical protein
MAVDDSPLGTSCADAGSCCNEGKITDHSFETGSSKIVGEEGAPTLQEQGALWIMLCLLISGCSGSMCCSSAQPLQLSGKLPVPEQKDSRLALTAANNLSRPRETEGTVV